MHRAYLTAAVLLVVLVLLSTGSTLAAFSPIGPSVVAPAIPGWSVQYQAPEGITLRGLKMLNTQVGYAVGGPDWGGQGNPYILKTTNGGTNWVRLDLPAFVNGWQGGIDCLSELHCLSVGTTGQAIRTTDGGGIWANSGMANGYGGYLYTAYWANSTTALAGGTNGHSFRSTNGGVTWTEFLPGGYVVIWEFQCFGSTCYGAGNGASFAYSTNTGASWSRRFAPQFDLLGLSFLNTNTGWVSAAHGEIYYTTDAGQSWVSRTAGINTNEKFYTNFYDIEMVDAQQGWVAGGVNDVSGRVYHTTNGGTTWTAQTLPAATSFVWEVDFVDATHGWAVTHDGKILTYGEPQGPTPTPTPTSTPTPTATPTPNVSAVQRQVASGLDDTHQRVSTGFNDLSALTVRSGVANGNQLLSAFRFTEVQIPGHVRVVNANLEINRTYQAGSEPLGITLRGAAQDNVPNFQTQPPLAVPTTQASVSWTISSTTPTGWLPSPNLASLVQEVVNRAGWQSGNALALLLANDASNTGYVDAVSYDGNPVNAARLRVDYAACLAADVDCSCDVAVNDVQLVAANWGLTSSSPNWQPVYDLVANGVIDAADIAAAASAWGQWGC